MNPVIQRLAKDYSQSFVAINTSGDDNQAHWIFQGELEKFTADFYAKIVPNHLILSLEYTLVRQQINQSRAASVVDHPLFKDQLEEALVLNELLERVYSLYLNVPREVKRLRNEHKELKRLFQDEYILLNAAKRIKFHGIPAEVEVGFSFAHWVRKWHPDVNLVRLLNNRGIRLLDVIAMIAVKAKNYQHFVLLVDTHLRPVMPYVACVFFLPRLLMNLFMLLKHTISGSWMSEQEKTLIWTARLKTHFGRRWFEVSNDVAWFFASIINCFVLVGALSPFGLYVSLTFFSYDVFLSAIRTYRELSVLDNLKQIYTTMLNDLDDKAKEYPLQKQQLEGYLTQIRKRREYEQLRLGFHVLSTVSVVLAVSCALTMFAGCPVIPLVGALWLVIVCVLNIKINAYIDKMTKPNDVIVHTDKGKDKKQVAISKSRITPATSKDSLFNKNAIELVALPQTDKLRNGANSPRSKDRLFNENDIEFVALPQTDKLGNGATLSRKKNVQFFLIESNSSNGLGKKGNLQRSESSGSINSSVSDVSDNDDRHSQDDLSSPTGGS